MIAVVHILILALIAVPFLMGLYLLFLTFSAWIMTVTQSQEKTADSNSFLFVIPAHNEEKLLPVTLNNLINEIEYDRSKVEVVVIADNCTDQTAELARQAGATVLERFDNSLKGKGYALEWGLAQCWAANKTADGVIILDADTIVSKNFLEVLNAGLANGQKVIQTFYSVLNPEESWNAGLRYAALAVLHYVRPLGRSGYGGSAGLKGNGMMFATEIIKNHRWSASLTEDIEFHMTLLLTGERVYFAPNATVWAEMPNTMSDANSQNERWETGRLEMAKKYVPKLFKSAFSRESIKNRMSVPQLDAIMEHIIPPFAVFNAVSVLLLIAAAAAFIFDRFDTLARLNLTLAGSLLAIQVVYLLSGLILTKSPTAVYKNLLYAPFYIIWKILLMFKLFNKGPEEKWIRTARNESS